MIGDFVLVRFWGIGGEFMKWLDGRVNRGIFIEFKDKDGLLGVNWEFGKFYWYGIDFKSFVEVGYIVKYN